MASFLSTAQKASLQGVMDSVHDTFKRSLKAFKDGKRVILSTNPNYSHIYKTATSNTTVEKIETTIEARVYYYARHQDKEAISMTTEDSLKLQQAAALVRIKVKEQDWLFLKNAERIELDSHPFEITSTEMPHGLFGTGFYTLFLKRTS